GRAAHPIGRGSQRLGGCGRCLRPDERRGTDPGRSRRAGRGAGAEAPRPGSHGGPGPAPDRRVEAGWLFQPRDRRGAATHGALDRTQAWSHSQAMVRRRIAEVSQPRPWTVRAAMPVEDLMSASSPGTETWTDCIATAFDRAWHEGQRPRIEDYLGK